MDQNFNSGTFRLEHVVVKSVLTAKAKKRLLKLFPTFKLIFTPKIQIVHLSSKTQSTDLNVWKGDKQSSLGYTFCLFNTDAATNGKNWRQIRLHSVFEVTFVQSYFLDFIHQGLNREKSTCEKWFQDKNLFWQFFHWEPCIPRTQEQNAKKKTKMLDSPRC